MPLAALDRAFDGPSWHGPALTEALDGLTEAEAAWRPAPDAHNAWEIVVHTAHWTWRALSVVDPEAGAFDESGTDFLPRPAEGRLGDDVDRLRAWHRRFREAVASERRPKGRCVLWLDEGATPRRVIHNDL